MRAIMGTLGLDLRLIHNEGALMVLLAGVDKRHGTLAALRELGVVPARCVGVGDAENGLDLLAVCGLLPVVANALPAVKRAAELVTRAEWGAGMSELIGHLLDHHLLLPVPET